MNYVYGSTGGKRGISYTITDKTQQTATAATTLETFDALGIIHTDKGIPNKIISKLTYDQLVLLCGEITAEKHGLHTYALYKHAELGNTVSVCKIDHGAKLANINTKLDFTPVEQEVLLYNGYIINAPIADFDSGLMNDLLEVMGVSLATFKTNVKTITIPVYEGATAYETFAGTTSHDDIVLAMNQGLSETAGSFGLKKVALYPLAIAATGGGKWGNKIQFVFTSTESLTNGVPTKSVSIKYGDNEASAYTTVGLVPNKSDEYGIQLYLKSKMDDKSIISSMKGDLNAKIITEEANDEALEEMFIEYYTVLIAKLEELKTVESAKATGDIDNVLLGYLTSAVTKYTDILQNLEDADVHPLEMIQWDGNTPFKTIGSYNLISLDGGLLQNKFKLIGGADGLVNGMRKFDINRSYVSASGETVVLADLYANFYDGTIDKTLFDYSYVPSVITYDIEYPVKVKNAIVRCTKHASGKRGDIVAVGGAFKSITDIEGLSDFHKSFNPQGFKYFLTAESCEIKDSTLNKNIRVPMVIPLIKALTNWYNGNRKNPVSDQALVDVIDNTIQPKIITSDEMNTVLDMDLNITFEVSGVHRLYAQAMSYVGEESRLKELHNAINFCYLIKDVHVALKKYASSLSSTSNLRNIQEKVNSEISGHSAWFESAPSVTLGYKDNEAELRGQVSIVIKISMYGTIREFNIDFQVDNANVGSSSTTEE